MRSPLPGPWTRGLLGAFWGVTGWLSARCGRGSQLCCGTSGTQSSPRRSVCGLVHKSSHRGWSSPFPEQAPERRPARAHTAVTAGLGAGSQRARDNPGGELRPGRAVTSASHVVSVNDAGGRRAWFSDRGPVRPEAPCPQAAGGPGAGPAEGLMGRGLGLGPARLSRGSLNCRGTAHAQSHQLRKWPRGRLLRLHRFPPAARRGGPPAPRADSQRRARALGLPSTQPRASEPAVLGTDLLGLHAPARDRPVLPSARAPPGVEPEGARTRVGSTRCPRLERLVHACVIFSYLCCYFSSTRALL